MALIAQHHRDVLHYPANLHENYRQGGGLFRAVNGYIAEIEGFTARTG